LIEKSTKRIIAGSKNSSIPNDIKSIAKGAFIGHRSLTKIKIPSSVESIETGTFNGCDSLGSITIDKDNKKYYSEENCLIERDTKTLMTKCKNSAIPNDIKNIKNGAFLGCHELTSITIPSNVKKIETGLFYGCDKLESIIVEATEPPAFYGFYPWAFRNYNIHVYVPKESIEVYKAAKNWKEIKNITAIEEKQS
jgi:hypothetical protein